jgi:hypothetical protein
MLHSCQAMQPLHAERADMQSKPALLPTPTITVAYPTEHVELETWNKLTTWSEDSETSTRIGAT